MKINKILGSLEQISEKFVGNIWLVFLQFEKFSVIRVLTYYNLKEIKKKFDKILIKSFENFQKFCECLKINAKFRKGCAIFSTLNLWNFYIKYYKTFIQKLEEKRKKNTTLSYPAHAFTVLSVLHLHLLVLVLYFATSSAPFAQIRELKRTTVQQKCGVAFLHS